MLANFSHIWAQNRRYLRLSSIYFKLDGKSTYTLSHPTKRCTDRRTRYHIDTETPCFLHGLHQHAPVSIHDSFIRIFVLFFYVCLKSIDLLFFPLVRARTPTLYSRVPRRSSMMTLWGVIVFDTELCAHADKRYQKGERNNWSINNNVEYRILHQENVLLFFLILSLFTKKYRAIALCNNVIPFLNCVLFKCSWKGFWLLYFNTCIMKLGFPFISSRRLSSKCTLVF